MASVKGRPAPRSAWREGQSGNPNGRPKRKPITDEIRAALFRRISSRDRRTLREAIKDRLVQIILKSDDKHALKAIEMIWQYMEGRPEQTVELQFEDALQDISAQTGAPIDWLRAKSREIAAHHLRPVDATYVPVDVDTPEPTADRVMAVRRQPREAVRE